MQSRNNKDESLMPIFNIIIQYYRHFTTRNITQIKQLKEVKCVEKTSNQFKQK